MALRMVAALGGADLAKLASFACYDAERCALSVFDSKLDQRDSAAEASRGAAWPEWHSRTWGFGFNYVYTRRLALDHPYDPTWHMGEDYSFLLQASKHGATCLAFTDDDARDPAVLHVLHQGSTAQTPTRPAEGADAARFLDTDLRALAARAGARRIARSAAAAARARRGLAE